MKHFLATTFFLASYFLTYGSLLLFRHFVIYYHPPLDNLQLSFYAAMGVIGMLVQILFLRPSFQQRWKRSFEIQIACGLLFLVIFLTAPTKLYMS